MGLILEFPNSQAVKSEPKQGNVRRKPGSNNLYLDFYYKGSRIVRSTGLRESARNREETQILLDGIMEKIEDGTFRFAKTFPRASREEKARFAKLEGWDWAPEPDEVVFKNYAPDWMKRFIDSCDSRGKQRDYRQIMEDRLLPFFGDRTFDQLTGVCMKEFLTTLVWRTGKRKGEPLSASRIRNIFIPLRAIWFDACEEHRWNLSDPFRYLQRQKQMPKTQRRTKREYAVFRFDDWTRLMDCFDLYYKVVAETMVRTGLIGSELGGLRKEMDIRPDYINICNSVVRGHEKSRLKTDYRKRRFPMTTALRKCLDTAMSQSSAESKYVFTMKSGRIFDVDSFRKNPWTSAFKKAGLPYQAPYSTRHTFAAWALTVGIDPNRLVNLMGHGSKQMVFEVYGRYVDGLEKDGGKILEYFGRDFLGLDRKGPRLSPRFCGENFGESPATINLTN